MHWSDRWYKRSWKQALSCPLSPPPAAAGILLTDKSLCQRSQWVVPWPTVFSSDDSFNQLVQSSIRLILSHTLLSFLSFDRPVLIFCISFLCTLNLFSRFYLWGSRTAPPAPGSPTSTSNGTQCGRTTSRLEEKVSKQKRRVLALAHLCLPPPPAPARDSAGARAEHKKANSGGLSSAANNLFLTFINNQMHSFPKSLNKRSLANFPLFLFT